MRPEIPKIVQPIPRIYVSGVDGCMGAFSKTILFAALFLLSAAIFTIAWRELRPSAPSPAPCPERLPGGLDPQRVVLLRIDDPATADPRRAFFRQDLEELLLAGRYQVVAAGGVAGTWPPHCVGWQVTLSWKKTLAPGSLNEEKVFLDLRRAGLRVEERAERSRPDPEPFLPELRQAIAARLEIAGAGRNASLHDPRSPGYAARLRAMRLRAEGRQREAAEVLAEALARGGPDASLAYHLGSLLADWGGDLLAGSARPSWHGESASLRLAGQAREKLEAARLHLDRSLEQERSAPAFLARGRLRAQLGEKGPAEEDLRAALALWPACGEAVRDLAQLQLARHGAEALETRLGDAVALLDPGQAGLRAELLYELGRTRRMRGDLRLAAGTYEQALDTAPAERRALQHRLRAALAEVKEELGADPR